jgi:hypothetical protein
LIAEEMAMNAAMNSSSVTNSGSLWDLNGDDQWEWLMQHSGWELGLVVLGGFGVG